MIATSASIAAGAVAYASLLLAAIIDIRHRRIPNTLVAVILVAGIVLRLLADPAALWVSLVIAASVAVALGLLASRFLIGWGDVKLIAVVTLLVPSGLVISLMPAIAIAGGALACLYLVARRALRTRSLPGDISRPGLAGIMDKECARIRARQPMPYAVAILGGVSYQTAIEAIRCWSATSCWL